MRVRAVLRKLCIGTAKVYALPMRIVLKNASERTSQIFMGEFMFATSSNGSYNQFTSYPKSLDGIDIKGTIHDFSDTAIVIQGPVITKDDFTRNTVRIYKKFYDNVHIIVSTWKDTDAATVEGLKEDGAEVILNDYPRINPTGNLNCQLVSSLAGVRRAKERGVKYVAKTRVDQRYYNPCALSLLRGMQSGDKIVMLGGTTNSHYAAPFHITDFFAFGKTSDVELLYQCEFDTEESVSRTADIKRTDRYLRYRRWCEEAEMDCRKEMPKEYNDKSILVFNPETKIIYNYFLKKHGEAEKYPSFKAAYDEFLRTDVAIADADSLGFFWFKYDAKGYHRNCFERGKLDMAKYSDALGAKE